MVSRRGLVAGAASMGAVLLGGCGPGSLQRRVNRAAEAVEGVQSSDLSVDVGGTFESRISGEIRCSVPEDELEPVFDEAWRAVVTILHDADEGSRDVRRIVAFGHDGSDLGPTMWIPEEERNSVVIADFYDRYELG